ncbi:MAG: tetratricopeptide repeat protein [Bacteroidota bacterium]
MAKVIQFPSPNPEKFGFKPVRKKRPTESEKHGQLNLFSGGKMVSLNPLSTFEEALMLDEGGNVKAKEVYEKAIQQGDSIADAYCNLGILESEQKNYTKAIDCFTRGLKEDPRHFEAHYNLANLYAEVGNLPLAKLHYQMSIEIEPDFPNSHFNLGLTLAMNKEIDQAIRSLLAYRSLVTLEEERSQVEELINSLTRSFR